MPETRQEPNGKQIENMAQLAHAVSAQGYVDVIAEEGGQGDVPTPPEIRHRIRSVGIREILAVVEAHHEAHADGHIRVGREIQIDLQHIADRRQEDARRRDRGQILGLLHHLRDHSGATVCQNRLFGQPAGKAGNAPRGILTGDTAVFQFLVDVAVAHDGTRDALMEQGGVQQQKPESLLRRHLTAIDIDDVGNELEGVKGDADGQGDGGNHLGDPQQGLHVGQEKARVLEDRQQPQADREGQDQPQLTAGGIRTDQPPAQIADQSHAHQQDQQRGASPGVEDQGEQQKHDVAGPDPRHDRVERVADR